MIHLIRAIIVALSLCLPHRLLFAEKGYIISNDIISTKSLSKEEVFYIFLLMQKYSDDGVRIKLFLPPYNSYAFKSLANNILNMSSVSYYEKLKYKEHTGFTNFQILDNTESVLYKVASTPNSIGYYHGNIAIYTTSGVNIITVK